MEVSFKQESNSMFKFKEICYSQKEKPVIKYSKICATVDPILLIRI